MATVNVYVRPEDGWVKVADPADYLLLRANPGNMSWLVAFTAGTPPPTTAPQASGSFTFAGNPNAADTISIDGTTFTFVAGAPANQTEIEIGADAEATIIAAMTVINTELDTITATGNPTTLIITAVDQGTPGNSITIAENATNVTVSGATLSGGGPAFVGYLVDCGKHIKITEPYTDTVYVRVRDQSQPQPDNARRFDVITLSNA